MTTHPFHIRLKLDSAEYIYCYKSVSTSLLTLSNFKLRFSPIRLLNDPLEKSFSSFYIDTRENDPEKNKLIELLRTYLKIYNEEKLKVLCFTQDMNPTNDALMSQSYRGYMRFRMWSQYANEGKGACFILYKKEFDRVFAESTSRQVFSGSGKVKYSDDYYKGEANRYEWQDLEKLSHGEDILIERIKKYYDTYILSKRTDWAQEQEYRYFTLCNEEFYIDISSSLAGVVLGYNHSEQLKEFTINQLAGKNTRIMKVVLEGAHAYIRGLD